MSKLLQRRNSFAGTTATDSTSTSVSKKDEKASPHYLRASVGSCHDLCKYGHKSPPEEEKTLLGGRRKKLPSHLSDLTLYRSAILDRSKDVGYKNLSLAKSSISLGEADRIAPKITPAKLKGVASSERSVPRTTSSTDHKNVSSDGGKMHPTVAKKTTAYPRYSSEVPNFDQKAKIRVKISKMSAKSKLADMTVAEKTRADEKFTSVKKSSLKRPNSSPSKLNLTKQVPVPSQASPLLSSKAKQTVNVKGKLASPPTTITGGRATHSGKTGRSPRSLSNSNTNGKEGSYMPRSSFSIESELTVSVVIQEDDVRDSFIPGQSMESALAELSSDATEYVNKSQPSPEETIGSISEDDGMESNGKDETSAGEVPLKSTIPLELLESLDDHELKTASNKYDSTHKQGEQNGIDGRVLEVEDSQRDDASVCQLSKQLTPVENADVYDFVLTESSSELEADGVKVNTIIESRTTGGKEEVGAHENLQESTEQLSSDEKHTEEPDTCPGSTSGNAAENVKADEICEGWNNNTSQSQSISETSSYCELLEEPKSMQIEPSDSTIHKETDELVIVSNDNTFEQNELKSSIFLQQSPEELSDDEFYEEYDFELSESDGSDIEDEGLAINITSDDYLKPDDQRPRRISALEQDDGSATPYKLKFRRGKIVELTPDSDGPRRLKFRRKSANDILSGEGQPTRRIYKRNITKGHLPTNPDVESPGFKLRHQDKQEKKDAQGLFNNVIEETASKLVESRISKVKALVGAFETVISLQDGKPTSSTPQASNSPHSVHEHEGNAPEEAV